MAEGLRFQRIDAVEVQVAETEQNVQIGISGFMIINCYIILWNGMGGGRVWTGWGLDNSVSEITMEKTALWNLTDCRSLHVSIYDILVFKI